MVILAIHMLRVSSSVSVVIVSIDHKKNLFTCLKSLRCQTLAPTEIIVVDNGSTKQLIDPIQKRFPFIIVVKNKENLGFPTAADQGARRAKGEYIFFLNDDAILAKDALQNLLQVAQNKKKHFFAVQANLRQAKTSYLESEGFTLTWLGYFFYTNRFTKKWEKGGESREIFGGVGGALLMKKNVYLKIGGFDKNIFLYQDDADICWRARKLGYKIYFAPDAFAYHQISATTRNMDHAKVLYESHASRLRVLLKNLQFPYIFIFPLHIGVLSCIAIINFLLGKFSNGLTIPRAILVTLANTLDILKQRNTLMRQQVIPDSLIFKEFPIQTPLYMLVKFGWKQLSEW